MPCFCLSLAPIVKVSSPMQEKASKRGIFTLTSVTLWLLLAYSPVMGPLHLGALWIRSLWCSSSGVLPVVFTFKKVSSDCTLDDDTPSSSGVLLTRPDVALQPSC